MTSFTEFIFEEFNSLYFNFLTSKSTIFMFTHSASSCSANSEYLKHSQIRS